MKTIQKLITAYLITVIFTACDGGGENPQPTGTGTISGTVSAALDQSPVALAEVSIGGELSVTSAADGSFELPNVPTGSAWLNVEAPGFDVFTESVQVQEGLNHHNILLRKSIYERDPFTMYLPPEIEKVNGVILYLTGNGGDGRPWIRGELNDDIFEAFIARQKIIDIMLVNGLAFMGNDHSQYQDADYAHPDRYQVVFTALEEFALVSGHPELAQAPVLTFGYSLGGHHAVSFAFHHPERTIAAYSYKGQIPGILHPNWGIMRHVPVFIHLGELDPIIEPLIPELYGPGREEGSIWAAGIEKGVAHEQNPPMDFVTSWMELLFNSRVPDEATPGTIPLLNGIPVESGWLGDLNTYEIMPHGEFQGDPASASWLPNEEIAQEWRNTFEK